MSSSARLNSLAAVVCLATAAGLVAVLFLMQSDRPRSPEQRSSVNLGDPTELSALIESEQAGDGPSMKPAEHPSDSLDLDGFMRHLSDAIGRPMAEDRALFLSLADPVNFIDRMYALRFHAHSGPSLIGSTEPTRPLSDGQARLPGVAGPAMTRFEAIPPELDIHIHADLHPSKALLLRWFNTQTGQTDEMDLVYPALGMDGSLLRTRPRVIGGHLGAWRLEVYRAGDELVPVAEVPIYAGAGEYYATADSP